MNCCIMCKTILQYTDNKTCDKCIYHIGYHLICSKCGRTYSRTNRERQYRSYKCRVCMFIEL